MTEAQLPGVGSAVRITRERLLKGVVSREDAFYLSSLEETPERFGAIIRAHWGVETGLHWVLHVQMREDECAVHVEQGTEDLAAMRRCALVLLRREDSLKKDVKIKSKRAACDNDYLTKLLLGGVT